MQQAATSPCPLSPPTAPSPGRQDVGLSLREWFDHTSDAVVFFTIHSARCFHLEDANQAACRALGIERDAALGRTPAELWSSENAEVLTRSLRLGLEADGPLSTEQAWAFPTGTRWFHVALTPMRHAGQMPHRIGVVLRDITPAKQLERALCDREEMFRRLVETAGVIPWEVDFQTQRFTYVGPQAVKRFGYLQAEWYREGFWADHIHPEDREPVLRDCMDQVFAARDYTLEYRMLTQSGEVVWVHDVVSVLVEPSGRVLLRGFLVDVTARRQAEADLRKLNAELEARVTQRTEQLALTNKELEAFCYSVSHDLRAPLRAIDGFSKAVMEDCGDKLDEDSRDALRRVRQASQRMGELIDDLLKLSRVTRSEMRTTRVLLSDLARTVASEIHATNPQRAVEWVIAPDLVANGDASLLRVALENLLGNSWKYTSRNERARIEFGCRQEGTQPVFYVRDDGAGFEQAYAGKLFQPFQRLHRQDEFEGTGIGLATVQRILARHGGRVRAESAGPGKGATVYFSFCRTPHAPATNAT